MSALRDTFLSRKSSSERMISKAPKASTKSDLSRSASDGAYAIYVPWGLWWWLIPRWGGFSSGLVVNHKQDGWHDPSINFFQVKVQESANSVHSWSDLARWQTWEDLDFSCMCRWLFINAFFCLGYIFFLPGISLGLVFLDHRRLPHPTDPVPIGSIGCSCRGPNQESHGLLCCSLVEQTGWLVTPRDLVGGIFSKSGVNYN